MDLESGTTLYIETQTGGRVLLTSEYGEAKMYTSLTIDEARTMANAILIAAAEAEE